MKNWIFAVTWLFSLAIAYWAGLSESGSSISGQRPEQPKDWMAVKPSEPPILMDDKSDTSGFPQGEGLSTLALSAPIGPVASEEVIQGSISKNFYQTTDVLMMQTYGGLVQGK